MSHALQIALKAVENMNPRLTQSRQDDLFDELVEALEAIVETGKTSDHMCACACYCDDIARAALAKVKGGVM